MMLHTATRLCDEREREPHPKGIPWCPKCRRHVSPVKVDGVATKTQTIPCLACYLRNGQAAADARARAAWLKAEKAEARQKVAKRIKRILQKPRWTCYECGHRYTPKGDEILCRECRELAAAEAAKEKE